MYINTSISAKQAATLCNETPVRVRVNYAYESYSYTRHNTNSNIFISYIILSETDFIVILLKDI